MEKKARAAFGIRNEYGMRPTHIGSPLDRQERGEQQRGRIAGRGEGDEGRGGRVGGIS